jgi:hypothetical protein
MDTTLPATPAEFIAAGVDPVMAANLAAQHNLYAGRGSFEDRAALPSLDNLPPPNAPAPPPSASPADAAAALEQHTQARLTEQLNKDFQPPANPYDYKLPALQPPSDEQRAADTKLASEFHAEGLPKFIVDNIGESLAKSVRTLANETPQQAQARIASNTVSLQRMWGGEYQANIAAADRLLAQMQSRSPAMRDFIERAAPLFTPLDIDSIVQFAKYRASSRGQK